ncbi:MAG: hypothetical protein IT464_10155 [Planctomycetes bacterium]|nr:hypothetical protein [Planctomycetota bacterium]
MPEPDESNVEWVPRDAREWVPLTYVPDQVTARMTITYLEAAGIEARVGSQGGRFTVEVPLDQFEEAVSVHQPLDSAIAPPMQETASKTGVHTGRHIRERMTARETEQDAEPEQPSRSWAGIVLKLAVVLAAVVLLLILLNL